FGARPQRRRHRPDHPQAVPQAGRADRLRRVPLLRLDPRRRDRAGAEPDPGHRAQLRQRLLPRARSLGAGGLRLPGDRGAVVRRHLLLQLHQDRAAAGDPRRGALPPRRGSGGGADRRRRRDRHLRGGRLQLRGRARRQAPAAERPRRHRDHARERPRDRQLRVRRRCRARAGDDRAVSGGTPEPMNSGPREWDADTYDEVSDPQFSWGMEVLERLELRGDEAVLDAGCGSGRVTAELAKRVPDGSVIAVDGSTAMVAKAKERLGNGASYLVADLAELEVAEPVDLVFSTATFHWILDHDVLFERLRAALVPGGRLVAQCGGEGNVARHAQAIATVVARPEFADHFADATGMWNFAAPEETEARLRR